MPPFTAICGLKDHFILSVNIWGKDLVKEKAVADKMRFLLKMEWNRMAWHQEACNI